MESKIYSVFKIFSHIHNPSDSHMVFNGSSIMSGAPKKYALILANLDYTLVDPSTRKIKTYVEIGWGEAQAVAFVADKKNWDNIASFNTTKVTFSASSRRNRFYEVFWQENFFAYDTLYPHINGILAELVKKFQVVVFSDRTEDQKEKTLARLKQIGVPVDHMQFIFKGVHETLVHFKTECVRKTHNKYQSGLVVLHIPADLELYRRHNFTPIGFTTTYDRPDFFAADAVCDDWKQIHAVLNTVQ